MNIKGVVLEQLKFIGVCDTSEIVFHNNALYCMTDVGFEKLCDCQDDIYTAICKENGLWVSRKESNTTTYIDMFDNGKSYNAFPYACSDLYFHSGIALLQAPLECVQPDFVFKQGLILIDSKNNKVLSEKDFINGFYLSLDDDRFYVRSNSGILIECYSYGFEKIWEYDELAGGIYIDFERKPQLYNDLVIINHAEDTIALDKKTGKEVWKYTFEDVPTSNILMHGKIYAVCKAVLYIINPQTGAVEVERDTGFSEYQFNDPMNKNDIGVFPLGDYLYGVAKYDENYEWLRLYNHDASKVLDKKTIPGYWLDPYGSILPVIHDGRIYQVVRNAYAYSAGGVLVIDIVEDESAEIKIPPRPPVRIQALPSLSEPHKLQVFLDANNLDDVLRYGKLITEEVFYATGYVSIYDTRENALDRKHNGQIELIIDDTVFERKPEEALGHLTDIMKESLESGMNRAGDKKTAIQFALVTQPKSKWDMSGEQLDWPEIRDQETPLA